MKYILLTYDAVVAFAQNRFYQSVEFDGCVKLCQLLTGVNDGWRDKIIGISRSSNGIIFATNQPICDRTLLFDLTTFNGFESEKDDFKKIVAIFQKTIRYAVKYFDNLPLSQNEVLIKGGTDTLVFPYQFVRSKEVDKIVLDRNSTKEAQRKNLNVLTAYSYERVEKTKFSKNILEKAVKDVSVLHTASLSFATGGQWRGAGLSVTDLSALELTVSSKIGLDNWRNYLTDKQRNFIDRTINGPERLEGAAGTGKTLTLVLRVITGLLNAERKGVPLNFIFFTHSASTKEMILDVMRNNCPDFDKFVESSQGRPIQSVLVTTLQEWCARHLGINDLQENEFLDKDAENSKVYQLLYIETAWNEVYSTYWKIFQNSVSNTFVRFLNDTPEAILFELLQKEFSEIIKGQAKSVLNRYLTLDRPRYGIPLENETDKRFLFQVFSQYQMSLSKVGQFDSDDIVISALGQIDSPIWNRRRDNDGYDACFIDETHLFNLNEISVFHFVNKTAKRNNIIFSIDRSQCTGDRYDADRLIATDENGSRIDERTDEYATVFRCSEDIVNLAYAVLSSGASLFTTLENPLKHVNNTFTNTEERKCEFPDYSLKVSLSEMVKEAFDWAQIYVNKNKSQRNRILFVATDNLVLHNMRSYANEHKKSHVCLTSRADIVNIRQSINDNKYVISAIDYVGGLEFDAVIIVGVDKDRVPPHSTIQSSHIINYLWYNRMYVAITRAKYAVKILGGSASGFSTLFDYALREKLITTKCNKEKEI